MQSNIDSVSMIIMKPKDEIEFHDFTEVYGDNVVELFPEIITPCDLSPSGQCEYSWRDKFHACIHCKKPSGLD